MVRPGLLTARHAPTLLLWSQRTNVWILTRPPGCLWCLSFWAGVNGMSLSRRISSLSSQRVVVKKGLLDLSLSFTVPMTILRCISLKMTVWLTLKWWPMLVFLLSTFGNANFLQTLSQITYLLPYYTVNGKSNFTCSLTISKQCRLFLMKNYLTMWSYIYLIIQ